MSAGSSSTKLQDSKTNSSDQETVRDTPGVPDYELIRCIGKGSYGEVWLARSLTGSLRAVKIVRRETFELERTFLREIEGLEKFEPISRGHQGLVDILHVGWNMDDGFCYYVMELADDRLHGSEIQFTDYEPRTLTNCRVPGERLPLDQCISIGISIADALAYLHKRNLIHRDIKPSNVVFVEGEAKLVDIGLGPFRVTGQRTFVGTEGFVPPEGPGTTSADLYSLGMVLYEISTGNDRLEFPELPEKGFSKSEVRQWQQLNEIICKACNPAANKRFTSASAMAEQLRELQSGRKPARRLFPRIVKTAALLTFVCLGGMAIAVQQGKFPELKSQLVRVKQKIARVLKPAVPSNAPDPNRDASSNSPTVTQDSENQNNGESESDRPPEPAPIIGSVRIDTIPAGATIFRDGKRVGMSGETLPNIPVGHHEFEIRLPLYDSATVSGEVSSEKPLLLKSNLQLSKGPRPGKPWNNSKGIALSELPGTTGSWRSTMPVSAEHLDFGDVLHIGPGNQFPAIAVTREVAEEFCDSLTKFEQKQGYIANDRHYEPSSGPYARGFESDDQDRALFYLKLTTYASLTVISEPVGAAILLNGVKQETETPITIPKLKGGRYETETVD